MTIRVGRWGWWGWWGRSHLLSLSLCLGLIGCTVQTTPPPGFEVYVDRVISGQTVIVRGLPNNPTRPFTIRLQGINAPDLQQIPWGEAARHALDLQLRTTPSVTLVLEAPEPDPYDRYWGDLWQDGRWINRWLVEQGYVLTAPTAHPDPQDQELSHAQDYARMKGTGLWNPDAPLRQAPADFRREQP